MTGWETQSDRSSLVLGAVTLFGAPLALAASGSGESHAGAKAADGSDAGQHGPLDFLKNLLFWELVSFALLFVALSVMVFPKMFGAMRARQERIEGALAKADKVQEEAEVLLKRHEKMMAEAQAEAKRITDEAASAAAKMRGDASEQAKRDAAEIVGRAKNEIRLAQNKAIADLRSTAVELSLVASKAVLQRALTGDDHRRLAEEAIAKASAGLANRN